MGHKGISVIGLVCGVAVFLLPLHSAYGDVSYSFPDEMKRGSVIGNIANDLGLEASRLSARMPELIPKGTENVIVTLI